MNQEWSDGSLAINGGPPVIPEGPPTWPKADDRVWSALTDVYQRGDWGRYSGEAVPRLCTTLADYHQVDYVLPCCSGTVAVELALRAVGIKAGDEVVLAAYDFPGNFRAIEAIGARPVLVDLEPTSWRPDLEQIASALSRETKAVVVSHLHGCLAGMPQLCHLAREAGIAVVEDACQSPGALLQGRRAGAWGDVGVLSFGGSKLLTAGRGGAILTNDARAFQRAKVFSQRGNDVFPLSELQAAVLMPQLEQLDERNRTRLENATRLLSMLQGQEIIETVAVDSAVGSPSFYKIGLLLNSKLGEGHSRAEHVAALRAEGLDVGEGFRGFHRRGSSRCRQVGTLPVARRAAEATILLHHPELLESAEMMDRVAQALRKVLCAFNGPA
jgi:perosamine synthetase